MGVIFICLYLFIGSLSVLVKSKEIDALVDIVCACKGISGIDYCIYLFFVRILFVLLFPFLVFLK